MQNKDRSFNSELLVSRVLSTLVKGISGDVHVNSLGFEDLANSQSESCQVLLLSILRTYLLLRF